MSTDTDAPPYDYDPDPTPPTPEGFLMALTDAIDWICREAGATPPRVAEPEGMTPTQRWNTASGVTLLGRKP